MRALVTGGGGFLGSHIAKRLLAKGYRVRILGRRKYSGLSSEMESVQADLRDRDAVISACEGQDVVFHAGAKTGIWGKRDEFLGINVEGTRNIIDGCKKYNVNKLIYTSSPSAVFDDTDMENIDESVPYPEKFLNAYPESKAIAEKMVLQANGEGRFLTVSLRPHLIWGPGDPHLIPRIIERAKMGNLIRVGDGKNKVDIIYIDNAAEGHLLACDALTPDSPLGGKSYFISDDEPVILWEWINQLLAAMGISPVTRSISYETAKVLGACLEIIYRLLHLSGEPRMTRFVASQLAKSHYFDISRAKKDFNYAPIVPPEEGMERLLTSLKSRPAN